jgi:hypothetical protein
MCGVFQFAPIPFQRLKILRTAHHMVRSLNGLPSPQRAVNAELNIVTL